MQASDFVFIDLSSENPFFKFGGSVIVIIIHKWSQNFFIVFQPHKRQKSNSLCLVLLPHIINFKSGPIEKIINDADVQEF